jgi:hypothetical protein
VYEAVFTVVDHDATVVNDTALVTILILDVTPPEVIITKPIEKSLYLRNQRVCGFPITLVIGSVSVTVNASDTESGVAYVAFSLNGVPMGNDTIPGYLWLWEERGFGRYTILVEAVDGSGNHASDTITVWRLF